LAKSGKDPALKKNSKSTTRQAGHPKPADPAHQASEQGTVPGGNIPAPLMEALAHSLEAENQGTAGEGGIGSMAIDPASRGQYFQSIQRMVGNRAVQRMMQRDPLDGGVGPTDAGPVAGVAADATPQDLIDFRAAGPYPADEAGTTIMPRTGLGGFNARYDPATQMLNIIVNIGFNFVNGMVINGDTVTAAENSMADSAIRINRMLSRLSGAEKQAALDQVREQWQWTGPGDPRITTFMAGYQSSVQNVWSTAGTGLAFQGNRTGWEDQLANINVVVNTSDITSLSAGAPIPGPQPVHCQSTIYKTPDEDVFGAFVRSGSTDTTPGNEGTAATDQTLELGSGQITAQSHLLNQRVFFPNNSSALDSTAQDRLRKIIISFQAPTGSAGTSIDIIGHASTTGEDTEAGRQRNIQLAEERAQVVDNFLRTTVVEGRNLANVTTRVEMVLSTGAFGSDESAFSRRTDIEFAMGQGQNIAAHEFGHMIGLGDEYASTPQRDSAGNIVTDANGDPVTRGVISGTGGDVGDATTHDALARDMGLSTGAVFENNDNIMSLGSTVRPQHYATFMQALRTVTSINDWQLRR
jgi:outer membrane protein OmpA-like peptidoglycan-associated protein